MKPGLGFMLIFSLLCFWTRTEGQSNDQIDEDSLDYFFQNGDIEHYYLKMADLARHAGETFNKPELDSLGQILLENPGDPGIKERKAIRSAAMWVGIGYKNKLGDFQNALQYYLIANQYCDDKEYLDELSWYVENSISTIYTRLGDYEKADYFSRLVEKSLKHLIATKNDSTQFIEFLSRYYTNLGIQKKSELKDSEAWVCFNRGFNLADSIQNYLGMHSNAILLTEYYIDHNAFTSSDTFMRIANNTLLYIKEQKNYKARKAELIFQSAKYDYAKGLAEGNDDLIAKSVPLFKTAIDTLREFYHFRKRREIAKYYISLARAHFELDSLNETASTINLGLSNIIADYDHFEYLPQPDQLYYENSFVELFELQSRLFQKQYQVTGNNDYLKKALQSTELGLKANDIIRDQVIADPSKLIAIQQNKILTHEGLNTTYTLYSLNAKAEYMQEARSLFNRSKSLLLDEKLRRNRLIDKMSSEDSTTLADLQLDIRDLHGSKFIDRINIDSLNGLILNDQEKIDNIFFTYSEAQLLMEERDDYIEYSMHDDDIYVLSSIRGTQQFLKPGLKSEFMKLLERMNDYILLKSLSEDQTVLRELFQFLINPVTPDLPGGIVIIPDGEIGFIPFEMLQDQNGRYLIESCTISYAYEYESYKPESEKTNRHYEIFCMAPTYQAPDKNEKMVTRGSLYQLPYAKAEADSIRSLFGTRALVSEVGTKDNLIDGLKQASIFHFAGHAIVKKDQAYLVVNSGGDVQQQLTEQEISLFSHSADLVVLSACETGLGKLEMGEGIRSLGRSFMEAGASSTIISLWSVNDKSTAVIMTAFYKYLLQGLMKDEALRKAKLEYISTVGKNYRHPYFWAAFVPAGDMGILRFAN